MNDREHRLRQRIDQLADERDDARDQLEFTTEKLALTQRVRDRLRNRVYELEHSRDLWRLRARQWRPVPRRRSKP